MKNKVEMTEVRNTAYLKVLNNYDRLKQANKMTYISLVTFIAAILLMVVHNTEGLLLLAGGVVTIFFLSSLFHYYKRDRVWEKSFQKYFKLAQEAEKKHDQDEAVRLISDVLPKRIFLVLEQLKGEAVPDKNTCTIIPPYLRDDKFYGVHATWHCKDGTVWSYDYEFDLDDMYEFELATNPREIEATIECIAEPINANAAS